MIHIGVDLHRRFCYVTAVDARGKVLDQRRVENDRDALQQYFGRWPKPTAVAFEACSFGAAFAETVEGRVTALHMVHPARVKAIASAKLKNDRVDSATLAQLLRCDLLPESWIADAATRQLRVRTRLRLELGRIRTQLKNRVHAILHRHGLRPSVSDVFGQAGRRWLAGLELPAASRQALDTFLALIEVLNEHISRQQKQLDSVCREDERIRWLTSIPGIGRYAASIILAEIGDLRRFDKKALYSYAGLVPWVRDSADKSYRGPITRAGSPRLRWIMVEAAITAMRTSPAIQTWYQRKVRRKPAHVVRVALARKLLGAVYALLRDGACFDENLFATM